MCAKLWVQLKLYPRLQTPDDFQLHNKTHFVSFLVQEFCEGNFLLVLLTGTLLRLNGGNSRWPITFVYKTNSKRPRFSVILFLFRHFLSNYKWRYLSAFSQIPLTELPQVTFSYTLRSVAVPQKLFNRGFIRISRSYLLF